MLLLNIAPVRCVLYWYPREGKSVYAMQLLYLIILHLYKSFMVLYDNGQKTSMVIISTLQGITVLDFHKIVDGIWIFEGSDPLCIILKAYKNRSCYS